LPVAARQQAGVSRPAAGLRVERRPIEDDLDLVTRVRLILRPARPDDRQDRPPRAILVVAEELGRRELEARVGFQAPMRLLAEVGRFPAQALLGVHRLIEFRAVDLQPRLVRQFGRQIEREAVGVVEPKNLSAGDLRLPLRPDPRDQGREAAEPARQRAPERRLLVANHPEDPLAPLDQFGVLIAHLLDHHARRLGEERALQPEQSPFLNIMYFGFGWLVFCFVM
jgi:hypothetical protein